MSIGLIQAGIFSITIGTLTKAMQNTGYWNTDLLFIFIICFFSPVILYFVAGVVMRVVDIYGSLHSREPEPVYVPVVETVYRESPLKKKNKKPKKPKNTKSKTKKDKPKNNTIIEEAISCLMGIGHTKKSAKILVEQIYNSKIHQKAEDIVAEAIQMCI